MIIDFTNVAFYIKPGRTDLRKQINGLAVLVKEEMNHDPLSGSLFLFCNRYRKNLKILYWDRNGFCLWQKRLEKHRFPWPETAESARKITYEELMMLLSGIDFFHAHSTISYKKIT
jgi:transposase